MRRTIVHPECVFDAPATSEPLLRKEGTAIVALSCDYCGEAIKPGDRAVAEANAPVGGHVDLDWFDDYLTEPQPIRFDLNDFQARLRAKRQ